MITKSPSLVAVLGRRFAGNPLLQTWALSLSSIVCLALLALAHHHSRLVAQSYYYAAENLRQSRVDLAKGYIHLCAFNDTAAASPYDEAMGLALMSQAIRSFERAAWWLLATKPSGADLRAMDRFAEDVDSLRALLARARERAVPRRLMRTRLRLSFHLVDRQASSLDGRIRLLVQQRVSVLGRRFVLLILGLALALAAIGALVFGASMASVRSRQQILRERNFSDAIIDSLPGPFALYGEEGRFLRWNRLFETYTGRGAGEIPSLAPADMFRGDDRTRITETIRKVFETGRGEIEAELVAADGRTTPFYFAARRIEIDGRFCLVATGFDIAERKRTEEALQRSEEKFRTLFENAGDGIFLMRGDRFVDCNGRVLDIYGCASREQIVGRGPVDFSPSLQPDGRESTGAARDKINAALAGRPQVFEWTHTKLDGTLFVAEVTLNKTVIGGEMLVQAVVRDITARKNADEALRSALREKEILLQELYHRTKNNMQVISAFLELQAAFAGSDEVARTIQDSSNRIHTMALAHQKLYEAKSLSRISMRDYLLDLAEKLKAGHGATGQRIDIVSDIEEIECLIDVAIPCGLIACELLTNCLKHAFPGGRKGRIDLGLHRGAGNRLELTVGDNGVGLPPDFDIAESATLGVQLVCQIAEHQLHGTTEVESDGGVRWYIRFNEELYEERV